MFVNQHDSPVDALQQKCTTSFHICYIECCCSDESCKHQLMKSDQFRTITWEKPVGQSVEMGLRRAGTTSNTSFACSSELRKQCCRTPCSPVKPQGLRVISLAENHSSPNAKVNICGAWFATTRRTIIKARTWLKNEEVSRSRVGPFSKKNFSDFFSFCNRPKLKRCWIAWRP